MGTNTHLGKHIAHRTANNSASIGFDDVFSASFTRYLVTGRRITLSAENDALDAVVGTGGVDDTGASDYKFAFAAEATNINGASATYSADGDTAHTSIDLLSGAGVEIDAGSFMEFNMYIDEPFSTVLNTRFLFDVSLSWNSAASTVLMHNGGGLFYGSVKRHTDVLLSIGTSFATGEFDVYGLR